MHKKPSAAKGSSRATVKPKADALADEVALNDCLSRRRCSLHNYDKGKKDEKCCPPQTGHHLIEASALFEKRPSGEDGNNLASFPNSPQKYNESYAPCVCAEGTSNKLGGTHELMHVLQSAESLKCESKPNITLSDGNTIDDRVTTYGKAKKTAINSFQKVFADSGCDPKCIENQLDHYHNKCGIDNNTEIKAVVSPKDVNDEMIKAAIEEANRRYSEVLFKRLGFG